MSRREIVWLTGFGASTTRSSWTLSRRIWGRCRRERVFSLLHVYGNDQCHRGLSTVLGEEIGWRGFLVPELAKRYGFAATAMISGIWALWQLVALRHVACRSQQVHSAVLRSAYGVHQQDWICGGRIWRCPWRDCDPHDCVFQIQLQPVGLAVRERRRSLWYISAQIDSPHTILCPSGVLRPNSLRPHGLFAGFDETRAPLATNSRYRSSKPSTFQYAK